MNFCFTAKQIEVAQKLYQGSPWTKKVSKKATKKAAAPKKAAPKKD